MSDREQLLQRIEALEHRVEEQQNTISELKSSTPSPTRRQVIGGLGTGLAGLVFGSATASGSVGNSGPVGTPNDRPTAYLDEIRNGNDDQVVDIGTTADFKVPVSTEQIDSKSVPTDQTGSRNLDTWYQNTTGTDLEVYVSVIADTGGTDIRARCHVNTSASNNQITRETRSGVAQFDKIAVTFTVPDTAYYKVVGFGNADESLDLWFEQT